jgi:hypothetical protein
MKRREETAMMWVSRLSIRGCRWIGLTALVLTAGAVIPPAQASGKSRSATSRATSTARTDRATSRGNAPRSDTATAKGRRVFGGSVAPAVRAPAFAPAPAPAAADEVWRFASSERSPSIVPVARDGAAVSSSNVSTNLTLGVLLLGAGALTLLGGLAAAALHGRVYVD